MNSFIHCHTFIHVFFHSLIHSFIGVSPGPQVQVWSVSPESPQFLESLQSPRSPGLVGVQVWARVCGHFKQQQVETLRCKQHIAQRAFNTCHARNFLVCTWLKMFELFCVLFCFSEKKVISSHPCFVALCLMHLSPHLSRLHFDTCNLEGAEQSPLAGYEPKTLIEVSSLYSPSSRSMEINESQSSALSSFGFSMAH